jgi:hypothetical protein
LARCGRVRYGAVRSGIAGEAWRVEVWMGTVWYRRHGEARCVLVWLCGERQGRFG